MKSVLLIGQSNMAGRGLKNEVKPIIHERILVLRNGRFQPMTEPLHNDRPNAGIGPAASFALAWCSEHPDEKIGLIPCAEGGSSIDEWLPGTSLFRHAVSEAKFALENSELEAILFHQGENDALNDLYQTYEDKLDQVLSGIRKELNAENVPIVVGGLPDFLGKSGYGIHAIQHDKITSILRNYAENHPNMFFTEACGLDPNEDGIHINAPSQRRFGLRYYDSLNQSSQDLSEEQENERLARLLNRSLSPAEQVLEVQLEQIDGKISFEEQQKRIQEIIESVSQQK